MSRLKLQSYLFLGILSLIWGSSFILMKKGLLVYSPSQVASMRVLFAGLVFLPYIIVKFRLIPWNKFKYIMLFGLLEVGIPPFLYTYGQTHVDSSTAGILNSLVPLFTLLSGMIFYHLKFHVLSITGVFVGLLGAVIITFMKFGGGAASFDITNSWGLLIVLATLLYGVASNILNEKLNDVSSIMITAVAFTTLAIPTGIYLFSTNFTSIPIMINSNYHALGAIIILAVFGSSLAILMFSRLIKISNALFASFVTYLIPFVSILWGWMDGEHLSLIHFSSLIVIFLGIYIANIGDRRDTANKLQIP